jgi:hypothetical protein
MADAKTRSGPSSRRPATELDPATRNLLEDWHLRATTAQLGHLTMAERSRNKHLWLGIPVVALTTVVGTSVFATFNESPGLIWKGIAGAVTILAAGLASIQTFLGYAQFAEKHLLAASRYAKARRSIELALARNDASTVHSIQGELDRVGAGAPQISQTVWQASTKAAQSAIANWRQGPPSTPAVPDGDARDELTDDVVRFPVL